MSKEENDNIVQALEHSGLCREFTQDEILSLIKEKDKNIKKEVLSLRRMTHRTNYMC